MRKRLLAIIATAAMVVTMIPAMAFADVATKLPAPNDGVITLDSDVELADVFNVKKNENIKIDLNGYEISSSVESDYGLIYVSPGGKLTITDSSDDMTGSVVAEKTYAIGNYGDVVIEGGNFTGYYALYNFYFNESTQGKATLKNGTFTSNSDTQISIANSGALIVSGCATINDTLDSSGSLEVTTSEEYGEPEINYLYIHSPDYADESHCDATLNGGVFGNDISEYLPEGYAALIEHYAGSNDFNDMKCWIVEDDDQAAIEAGAVAKITTDGVTRYYLYFGEAEEAAGENGEVIRMAYEISFYAVDPNGREDLSKSSYLAIPNTYANINDYLKATGEEIQEPDPVEGYKFVGWYVADDYEWLEEDGSEMYDFVKNLKYSNVKLDLSAELDEDAQYFAKWEKVDAAAGTTDASKPADAVDTGDDSNMAIPFAVAGIALAAIAAVVATRRRHS